MIQQKVKHFSLYINLCVNNFSYLTFGLFSAKVRFFLLNIFVSKNDTNIQIYLYKKMIQTNIRIYSYKTSSQASELR